MSAGARAQDVGAAERALDRADFAEARRLAQALLETGTLTPSTLAPVYRVLAMASAHLELTDEARRSFTTLLALDGDFRLSPDAPDTVRSPYMEARGFWSTYATKLDAKARLTQDGSALIIEVVDPANVTARVRARTRVAGQKTFVETVRPVAPSTAIAVQTSPSPASIAYSLAMLDEYGNRVWTVGSDAEPIVLGSVAPSAEATRAIALPVSVPVMSASPPEPAAEPQRRPRAFYVMGSLAMTLGAGAIAGAVLAHKEREDLAKRWNRGDCKGDGATRGMICHDEHARLVQMQKLAISLYGAGAAALLTGIVVLAVAPARNREARAAGKAARAFRCDPGPGRWGLACTVGF